MSNEEKNSPELEAFPTLVEKTGLNDSVSSDSDDHFSDAHSGLDPTSSDNSPRNATRFPLREEPGTSTPGQDFGIAPEKRDFVSGQGKDKLPSNNSSNLSIPIPITVVEKVDPSALSHGEIPGTAAHEIRAADAAPDLVVKASVGRTRSWSNNRSRSGSTPGDRPIPITKVERIDRRPSHGEIPGTLAYEARRQDAIPDIIEEIEDVPGKQCSDHHISERLTKSVSPTLPRSLSLSQAKRSPSILDISEKYVPTDHKDLAEEVNIGEFGDDFDEFEEGGEDAEFGDFDNSFQEATPIQSLPYSVQEKYMFPALDFTRYGSQEEIQSATEPYLDAIFPPDSIDNSVLPSIPTENSTFLTPRSASLWTQLVAPPSLQPPNWIQSRIRRLFLVSLGVPVDLDEILPASKQKKLILPSMNINPTSNSPRNSSDSHFPSRLKKGEGNSSTTSLHSQGKPSHSDTRRASRPKPAPVLDLVSARQLCATTKEALNGFTDEEIQVHIQKLTKLETRAKEVLHYWTERTDEKLGDREAFEGVIENLVKHARKTRK